MNANLSTALNDLVDAIREVALGSLTDALVKDAGLSLIQNWNDHNPDDQIDERDEIVNWLETPASDVDKILGKTGSQGAIRKANSQIARNFEKR